MVFQTMIASMAAVGATALGPLTFENLGSPILIRGLAVQAVTPKADGGDTGLDNLSRYVDKFVGDRMVDMAIVTHADQDHYLGMFRIFDTYDVGEFWYTG